jgi:FkbM family methyltransferase
MFKCIQHYAHAIALRAGLICELSRAARLGKAIPTGIRRRVLMSPHKYDDKILLLRLIEPNAKNLLIDVGGNNGYWAESFLTFFPGSTVIAFEPLKKEYAEYRTRFADNPKIQIHNVGLSSKAGAGELKIASTSTHSSLHTYTSSLDAAQLKVIKSSEIALETLDNYQIRRGSSDRVFLKIDVQGHEVDVLKGARQTLEQVDVVLVECSFALEYAGAAPSFSEVTSILAEFGMHPLLFRNFGNTLSPHAWERDVVFCKQDLLECIWGW